MVNNKVDSYSDNEKVHLKETKIQFQIKCIDQPDQVKATKLVDKIEKLDYQLNSIENINLSNDCDQIKQTKLNDDDFFEFISKAETYFDNEITGQIDSSVISNYLTTNEVGSNENLTNEIQFLSCAPTSALDQAVLVNDFENSIELNESDGENQSNNKFSTQANTLQNDPFLSFLPHHHLIENTMISKSGQKLNTVYNDLTNEMTNQTKMLQHTSQEKKQPPHTQQQFTKQSDIQTNIDQNTLDNQDDLFQQLNNHNLSSDYIKMDRENVQINKSISSNFSTMNSSSINSIKSIDSNIQENKSISSPKLNGDDLLLSLTSEDLNEMINYFPLSNIDLSKEKFNCSPSLDSLNSGDSMFCSSVWDSPPPSSMSSNNSSLNNDLDLPFRLSAESNELSSKGTNKRENFLDSEFPFFSEDSIFDSFINSNLNDLITTDEFLNEKCTLNDELQFENNLNGFLNVYSSTNFPCFNNLNSDHGTLPKIRKPQSTLSKDSNLAKLLLLKEKLPIKLPAQNSNQINNQTKSSNDNYLTNSLLSKSVKEDLSIVNKNQTNNSSKCSTSNSSLNSIVNNITTSTSKGTDLKRSNLITGKFTLQGLNTNDKISTGCLARSIKIIDPLTTGNSNVKYVMNNITQQTNDQTTSANSFSLNLTPSNYLTVTTNATSTDLTNLTNIQLNSTTTTANLSTTKSFIIKSVDGKFANRILYTPIPRNCQTTNITYSQNSNGNNVSKTNNQIVNQSDKTKIMAAFTPNNLFINNRKLVQKRPYSSISVSLSNTVVTPSNLDDQTKDFYSIDLMPKKITTVQNDYHLISDLTSCEMKKKMKTLDTISSTNSKANKNYSSKLPTNSVLLNLLLNGEDVNNGYLKSNTYKQRCNQAVYKPHTRIV